MFESQTSAALLLLAKHRASARRDNNAVHKAADAHYKATLLAVQYAFLRGRKAYKSGGIDAAVKAIRAGLLVSLPSVLGKVLEAGGKATVLHAASLRTLAPIAIRFDVADPNAVKWAKEHAAELADGISETSRERIKDAVARAVAGAGYDDILDAVGSEARADVIARTETMTAANEGQREAWDQAVEKGLLSEDSKAVWIATSDCCDDCDDLDGETRDLDGEYPDPGADGPPLHPNCRCTEGIAG